MSSIAGGSNHKSCCEAEKVPPACMAFCTVGSYNAEKPFLDVPACDRYMPLIYNCLINGTRKLNIPQQSFSAGSVSVQCRLALARYWAGSKCLLTFSLVIYGSVKEHFWYLHRLFFLEPACCVVWCGAIWCGMVWNGIM